MVGQDRLGIAIFLAVTLSLPNSALATPPAARPQTDLPLAPGEIVKPFANGCGRVATGPRAASSNDGNANWYGDCRFGLAHGDGIEHVTANNSQMRRRFQFGVVVGSTDARSRFPFTTPANDGVYLTMSLEDGRRDWVRIRSPELNVQSLRAAYPVSLTLEEPGQFAIDTFAPVALSCSPSGKVDWKGLNVSAADSVAANAECERYQSSLGSARAPLQALLSSVSPELVYIEHTHQTRPTGGVASPKEITARFCAGGAKSANCDRVLQEMLQPYAPRIQAIIDGQRRQYAEGLPWLAARYAPLEAAFSQKVRSIAARYAAASQAKEVRP